MGLQFARKRSAAQRDYPVYNPLGGIPLTREAVLERVSQEAIFYHYLRIPVRGKKYFCNPLREDRHAGCSFFLSHHGRLVFMDWASGEQYDCFDAVMQYLQVGFYQALQLINQDFQLGLDAPVLTGYTAGSAPVIRQDILPLTATVKAKLSARSQPMSEDDLGYWKQFGADAQRLEKYEVFAARTVFNHDKPLVTYSRKQPVYGYEFEDKSLKIYRPFADRQGKWFNCAPSTTLQGYVQLPETGDLLLISKAMKDVMSLDEQGIPAISPQSESGDIKGLEELRKRFSHIVVLYDNDDAGRAAARQLQVREQLYTIEVPVSSGCKDLAEYRRQYGKDNTSRLLDQLIA